MLRASGISKPRKRPAIRHNLYGGLLQDTQHEEREHEKYAGTHNWQAEQALSRLFRTSIHLQSVFDRCFQQFGITAQEAALLLHCVDEGETSAGKLAQRMGRDKGKITRFVDHLQASGFLTRRSAADDRRLFIISVTSKGRRLAPELKARFDEIRSRFFQGVANVDVDQFEAVLSRLHENAELLKSEK